VVQARTTPVQAWSLWLFFSALRLVQQPNKRSRRKGDHMTDYNLRFLASQAAPGIVFTAADKPNPLAPGNFAGWSSDSFQLGESNALTDLAEDGGQWVGTVHVVAEDVINMTATYFPVRGSEDNVQLAGPIMLRQGSSAIAIVGGAGRFSGARGTASLTVAMSDKDTPIYRYELNFSA
jgi:hypothetical protein